MLSYSISIEPLRAGSDYENCLLCFGILFIKLGRLSDSRPDRSQTVGGTCFGLSDSRPDRLLSLSVMINLLHLWPIRQHIF